MKYVCQKKIVDINFSNSSSSQWRVQWSYPTKWVWPPIASKRKPHLLQNFVRSIGQEFHGQKTLRFKWNCIMLRHLQGGYIPCYKVAWAHVLLAGALSHPYVSCYRFSLVLIERRRMLPNNHILFLLSEASLITLGDRNLCNFNK